MPTYLNEESGNADLLIPTLKPKQGLGEGYRSALGSTTVDKTMWPPVQIAAALPASQPDLDPLETAVRRSSGFPSVRSFEGAGGGEFQPSPNTRRRNSRSSRGMRIRIISRNRPAAASR